MTLNRMAKRRVMSSWNNVPALGVLLLLFNLQIFAADPDSPSEFAKVWKTPRVQTLMNSVKSRKYLDLEQALSQNRDLPSPAWLFFTGVLANRKNDPARSTRLLEPLARSRHAPPELRKFALLTLADNEFKLFQYRTASKHFAQALEEFGSSLDADTRDDVNDNLEITRLMQDFPVQELRAEKPFSVQTRRNPVGLVEAPVEVNGETKYWLLDTGAGLTTLSLSHAQKLGLKLSSTTVRVTGAAGRIVPARVALIPVLRFGDAEVRNVAALVMQDKDASLPNLQMDATLGYPVLAALGKLTCHMDGRLECNPASDAGETNGAEMFLDEEVPLVAAKTAKGPRLFELDTGAVVSFCWSPYWNEIRTPAAERELHGASIQAVGGGHSTPAYTAPAIQLAIGTVPVALTNVTIFAESHDGKEQFYYGTLGQDILHSGYTIDYRAMRFQIQP